MSSKCHPNVIQMSLIYHNYNYMLFRWSFIWSIWTIPHDVLWKIRRSGFVLPVWLSLIWCIWDLPEWTIIHHTHPCRDTGIVCLNAVWHGISQHLGVLAYKFLDCRKNVLCLARVWYNVYIYIHIIIEGSLEVKLPTIWTDEKQSRAEAERRERSEERRVEEKE